MTYRKHADTWDMVRLVFSAFRAGESSGKEALAGKVLAASKTGKPDPAKTVLEDDQDGEVSVPATTCGDFSPCERGGSTAEVAHRLMSHFS